MARQAPGESSLPEFSPDFQFTSEHLRIGRQTLEKMYGSSADFSDEQIKEMVMDTLRLVWTLRHIAEARKERGAAID